MAVPLKPRTPSKVPAEGADLLLARQEVVPPIAAGTRGEASAVNSLGSAVGQQDVLELTSFGNFPSSCTPQVSTFTRQRRALPSSSTECRLGHRRRIPRPSTWSPRGPFRSAATDRPSLLMSCSDVIGSTGRTAGRVARGRSTAPESAALSTAETSTSRRSRLAAVGEMAVSTGRQGGGERRIRAIGVGGLTSDGVCEELMNRYIRKRDIGIARTSQLTFFSSTVQSTRPMGSPALSLRMIDVTPASSVPTCPELLLRCVAHSMSSTGRSLILSSSNNASMVSREYLKGLALLIPAVEEPLTTSAS